MSIVTLRQSCGSCYIRYSLCALGIFLRNSCGVVILPTYEIDADNLENNDEYLRIKKEHKYNYEDIIEISEETMKIEEIGEKIDSDNIENNEQFLRIKKEHGYNYEDTLEISEETMKKELIEESLKRFYSEHLHEDDEVRYFLEGGGYLDVRDPKDNWIRIHFSKGDLMVLPAGIYHRFNLGKWKYVKIRRFFSETQVWIAKFRPEADSNPSRQKYLKNILLK